MRKNQVFWGGALILLGMLFLLQKYGLLARWSVSVWGLAGPLLLVILGAILAWRAVHPTGHRLATEELSIPLRGAGLARLVLRHGAGRLQLADGAAGGELLAGSFVGGVLHHEEREGLGMYAELRQPQVTAPWFWNAGQGLDWQLRLNPNVRLALEVKGGASAIELDLAALKVEELRLENGVSSSNVRLPAQVAQTRVVVKSGVSSVTLQVPEGVAARIHYAGGLASMRVDTQRFPWSGGNYVSPDYEVAQHRVEIEAEVGVATVVVR